MGLFFLSGGTMPKAPVLPTYVVTLTAYNAVPEQTDGNPLETASGAYSNPEIVAARSQDLASTLPFGTIIELDGPAVPGENCGYDVVEPVIGYRVIADSMNARFTNRIDILFTTKREYRTTDKGMKNAAQVFGICKEVTVRVVGRVDINHIPKTQTALAVFVNRNANTLALK